MTSWVYLLICANSLWCFPEHVRWSAHFYQTEEECYAAAGKEQPYVLDRGWTAICLRGRNWSPTEDRHYGCSVQSQAPNGECK